MSWLLKSMIWIDVQINDKWFGGRRETISGRLYRNGCPACRWICWMLDKVDPDHCHNSYINDRIRNGLERK